jgi:putative sugar O-methyltransferase
MVARIVTDDARVAGWIEAMRAHVAGAPAIYRPGAFWEELLERDVEMLRAEGVRNFKRTVNNNYYNWLVISWTDPQMRAAVRRWVERPSLAPLLARMEPAADIHLHVPDQAFRMSAKAARRYRPFVAAAWEHARREDGLGLTDRLEEPEIGNPVRIRSRGRRISQDLANSIVECNYVARSGLVRDGARVAELGAGYGRLAHVFSAAASVTYCIFDIPPALAIAQWYLGELLGPDRVMPFRPDLDVSALRPGTIALFTPDQLERFPDGWFDVTQTISTLPEMPEPQARRFLDLLAAKCSGELFLKQWRQWRNEADDVDFDESRFAPPAPWRLVARRVDPIQPRFYNRRWRRAGAA